LCSIFRLPPLTTSLANPFLRVSSAKNMAQPNPPFTPGYPRGGDRDDCAAHRRPPRCVRPQWPCGLPRGSEPLRRPRRGHDVNDGRTGWGWGGSPGDRAGRAAPTHPPARPQRQPPMPLYGNPPARAVRCSVLSSFSVPLPPSWSCPSPGSSALAGPAPLRRPLPSASGVPTANRSGGSSSGDSVADVRDVCEPAAGGRK
jgi:hypothetical protein